MKKFNSGEELAKEIGCSPEALKKTCKLMFQCYQTGSRADECSR